MCVKWNIVRSFSYPNSTSLHSLLYLKSDLAYLFEVNEDLVTPIPGTETGVLRSTMDHAPSLMSA